MGLTAHCTQELEHAKRVIDELENELTEERARLRTLSTEQSRVQREKDQVAFQLRRTESVSYYTPLSFNKIFIRLYRTWAESETNSRH